MIKKDVTQEIIEVIQEGYTNSVTSSVTRALLPDSAWLVLARFGSYNYNENPRAFTITELRKLMKDSIHINTIRRMLQLLESKAVIRMVSKNAGVTRCGYRYIITTDGLRLWERYKEELKENIGKVEI